MNEDRFGVTDEALQAEREIHKDINRTGMFVPTRNEVATLPPDELHSILDQWMWESPTLLIPTDQQISEVIAILEMRLDQAAIAGVLEDCRRYVANA